jgi:hypothetical protein
MTNKLFNNLLLFSLFGVALGFFGILYEGVVNVPKMLDSSMPRMLFWKNFYEVISPIPYYIPVVPIATITLIVLYFKSPKQKIELKNRLKLAGILQITSLVLTFYIVKQMNLKFFFGDIEKYADIIPTKTLIVNIISVIRVALTAVALVSVFKAYIYKPKKSKANC